MQSQKNEFLNLTTFPFDSHISTPLKKKEIPLLLIIEIPTSLIPLLFLAHIPSITTKNRQIPHPTKATEDPPYCGRQKEPATYSWSAALKILPNSVHSWNAPVVLTNMHGMWPQRPWY